jgi:hypothetical protein
MHFSSNFAFKKGLNLLQMNKLLLTLAPLGLTTSTQVFRAATANAHLENKQFAP